MSDTTDTAPILFILFLFFQLFLLASVALFLYRQNRILSHLRHAAHVAAQGNHYQDSNSPTHSTFASWSSNDSSPSTPPPTSNGPNHHTRRRNPETAQTQTQTLSNIHQTLHTEFTRLNDNLQNLVYEIHASQILNTIAQRHDAHYAANYATGCYRVPPRAPRGYHSPPDTHGIRLHLAAQRRDTQAHYGDEYHSDDSDESSRTGGPAMPGASALSPHAASPDSDSDWWDSPPSPELRPINDRELAGGGVPEAETTSNAAFDRETSRRDAYFPERLQSPASNANENRNRDRRAWNENRNGNGHRAGRNGRAESGQGGMVGMVGRGRRRRRGGERRGRGLLRGMGGLEYDPRCVD